MGVAVAAIPQGPAGALAITAAAVAVVLAVANPKVAREAEPAPLPESVCSLLR